MIVKLLIEHHLKFLSLTEATPARLSLHLSKYHFVGNHMPRLKCEYILLFCGLVEELIQGIKRFESTCVSVFRKNEYLTRKNSWPVMQQENQKVSEYDQEMPQPHTRDQPMA